MSIATFPPPSLAAQYAELKREKGMRARVYPHLIATGKLKREAADYQNRAFDAALATLEALALGKPVAGAAPTPDPLRAELCAALRTAARRLEEIGHDRDWIDELLAKVPA